MQIVTHTTDRGFSVEITGNHFQAPPCNFSYPEAVWHAFPAKEALIQELAYVTTLVTPLMLEHPEIHYDTPAPRFMQFYHDAFEASIPNIIQYIEHDEAGDILNRFRALRATFADKDNEALPNEQREWNQNSVILPFSYGKDSLMSMALLQRLEYETHPVNIMQCVQPRVHTHRERVKEAFEQEFSVHCDELRNELLLFTDHEILKTPESQLRQSHLHFVYVLGMLPFCYYYNAPSIILSNEFNNSLNRVHRQGLIVPMKVMQSQAMARKMAVMVTEFTDGKVTVENPLGGVNNFVINQLLLGPFSAYEKYRMSCDMELSPYSRWCHNCIRCAQAYLMAVANGIDPKNLGFEADMFAKKFEHHFASGEGTPHPENLFAKFAQHEEMLAALMAVKHGGDHRLLNKFGVDQSDTGLKKKLQAEIFRYQIEPEGRIERNTAQLCREILPTN